ncbi:DMT family transporter [bacterium]|nr:DMT family transporter [bacterium]
MNVSRWVPFFYVVLAAFIWGLTGVFVKGSDLSVIHLCLLRVGVPVLISVFFLTKEQLFLHQNKYFVLISVLSVFRLGLQIFSFKYTSSLGTSLVLIYCWPMFHYVVLMLFKKERFSWFMLGCLLSSFSGVGISLMEQSFTWDLSTGIASLAALAAAIIVGVNTMLIKEHCNQLSAMETVYIFNCVGAGALLPFCGGLIHVPVLSLGLGVIYGLVIGWAAFWLFFKALNQVASSQASVLAYIEVPSGMLCAFLLFQEGVTFLVLCGGLVIFLSSLVLLRHAYKETPA